MLFEEWRERGLKNNSVRDRRIPLIAINVFFVFSFPFSRITGAVYIFQTENNKCIAVESKSATREARPTHASKAKQN